MVQVPSWYLLLAQLILFYVNNSQWNVSVPALTLKKIVRTMFHYLGVIPCQSLTFLVEWTVTHEGETSFELILPNFVIFNVVDYMEIWCVQRNDVHLHPYGKSHMLNMGEWTFIYRLNFLIYSDIKSKIHICIVWNYNIFFPLFPLLYAPYSFKMLGQS